MSDKHLVCKGATVYCSKSMVNNSPGTAIPLTITSNTLVELNGGKVAATDKDCTPANMCFGNCNTGTNPPPPCVANVQWSKFYEGAEVTEAGMKLLTEESEATCMAFGGKVKIAFHGQVANPQPEEPGEVSPEVMVGILFFRLRISDLTMKSDLHLTAESHTGSFRLFCQKFQSRFRHLRIFVVFAPLHIRHTGRRGISACITITKAHIGRSTILIRCRNFPAIQFYKSITCYS